MADIVLNHIDEAKVMDAVGMRNLPWKGIADNPLAPAVVDINWLTAQPLLPFLVNAIPAPLLYRSIQAHGLEDSIEVIEWIRGEKLLQILDFDLWAAESRLESVDVSTDKFLNWVRLWIDVSPSFAAERFAELDEGTIVVSLSKLLDIQPDQMTSLNDLEKDEYYKTPDGAFYIRLRSNDNPESFEIVHQLIDALYKQNIVFAQSCLAHASLLVRDESLEDELRLRTSRLSDNGFVSSAEAFELLKPRPVKALFDELKNAKQRIAQRRPMATSTRFSPEYETQDDVLIEAIVKIIKTLPEDMAREEVLRAISPSEIKLLTGSTNAPETLQSSVLLDDDEVLEAAARSIAKTCTYLLNRFDFSRAQKITPRLDIEQTLAELAEEDEAYAGELKARIARLANTVASWNSPLEFPDDDLQVRAATLVRGFLNIGLELAKKQSQNSQVDLVREIGAEMLFKIGYSQVCETVTKGGELIEVLASQKNKQVKIARTMALGRFVEARLWLSKNQSITEPALYHVLNALLNKIPMYPVVLSEKQATHHASAELKAFELLSEVENVEHFFDNLSRNASFQEML